MMTKSKYEGKTSCSLARCSTALHYVQWEPSLPPACGSWALTACNP